MTTKAKRLLTTKGSFTQELERLAGTKIDVYVLFVGLKTLSLSEKQHLHLPIKPTIGYVRETILYAQKSAWVQARTVMPLSSLQGDARRLRHLKDTPIGYVLFKKQIHLPHQRFVDENLLARQTLYDWHNRKLLISEQLLPDLIKHLNNNQTLE